jgi:hypothetical protein
MEKIVVKTKINMWAAVGDKEKIVFDTFDFAPDQVAAIDRLIRHNKEDKVSMTIEPENKQLQFGTVESNVRLVSMNCMGKGQKIKIADFKSSDERASTLKRMVESETVVIITIEQIQGGLFDDKENRPGLDDNQPDPQEDIEIKTPKKWGVRCLIKIGTFEERWRYGYCIKIGNVDKVEEMKASADYSDLHTCCEHLLDTLYKFINEQGGFKQSKSLKKKILDAVEKYQLDNS